MDSCIRQLVALICRLMDAAAVDAVLCCGSSHVASVVGTAARKRGAL
jgi:hypothetical protein